MKLLTSLTVALLSSALLQPLHAANRSWQNPISGSFSGEGNQWNTVPNSGDSAMFDGYESGSAFTVSLIEDVENLYLRVSGAGPFAMTFNLSGYTYTTTSTTNKSVIGRDSGNANTLILTGGGTFDSAGFILGNSANSQGTLQVNNGVIVKSSQEVRIGNNGSGLLNISGGAKFQTTALTRIAYGANSTGKVEIEGPSSSWITTREAQFGQGANSTVTLLVSAGGLLENSSGGTDGAINFSTVATAQISATVTGEGSKIITGGQINIGGSRSGAGGAATVEILDGGLMKAVTTLNLYAQGILTIDDGVVEAREFGSSSRRADGVINLTLGEATPQAMIRISTDIFLGDAVLNLTLGEGVTYGAEEVIRLIDYKGALQGTFANITEGEVLELEGQKFLFSYNMTGSQGQFIGLTAIPEAGSYAMISSGLVLLIGFACYRSKPFCNR